ncbi:hypothetical protein QBC47DRAFT_377221 [Echria macrotheca]|uniref:Uncharacterized protein n=1 Tax=Echria macrotheca TaxID=438768 RepID=A0AAJ0BL73_9PEZI|nr:hypothetical protein QBC47DRAFT_377221 [Echria macrotheca]
MTPFVHIPHCRLDMTTVCNIPHQSGHIEEVALPGPTIRTLLTSLTLPDDTLAPSILSHFDDHDDWVHSRCVQSDFSGLGEHEARRLSDQGRLCCWASMMLRPGDTSTGGLQWDLCFVIHKVVARRDSESSRCACP